MSLHDLMLCRRCGQAQWRHKRIRDHEFDPQRKGDG